jgi:putative oxidoreductase
MEGDMDTGLLLIRVVIGLMVASHGAQKLFGVWGGYGIAGTAGFLETLGFRPGRPYTWLLALAEFAGGIAFAAGFLTPFAAAAVGGVMIAAIAFVHWSKGFFAQNNGYEFPLALAATAFGVAFTGPGQASLDNALDWELAGTGWGIAALAIAVVVCALVGAGRALVSGRGRHAAA